MAKRPPKPYWQSVIFEALEDRLLLSLPPAWTSVGVGGGGSFFSPAFSPNNPNEIYVATDMSDEYHSTDLGVTWQVVDYRQLQGCNTASVQFTNNPNILYAPGPNSNPVKSTDGGATWNALASNPMGGVYALFADYNNPSRLIASSYSQIYFSNNGGTSFTSIYSDSNGAYVAGVFFDGVNITVATNTGLLVSNNNGVTFPASPVGGIPSGEGIFSFAGAKAGGTTRYFAVTVDSTEIWPGQSGSVHTSYLGVYSIDVGQANWTKKVTGIASADHPVYVGMALNNINTAYLGGGSDSGAPTVYKTTNGGGLWTSVFNTTNNGNIQTGWQGAGGDRGWSYGEYAMGFAVAPLDPAKVMITDLGGVHLTANGGTSWKAVYVNPSDLNPAGQSTPTGKDYHGNGLEDTSVWWLTWSSATNIFASFTDIRAIRSTDGGASWSFRYTGHTRNTMYQAIVQPGTGRLYAAVSTVHDIYQWRLYLNDGRIDAGGGAVLTSNDQGANWSLLHDFGRPAVWVTLDPNNANHMYVSVANHAGSGSAGGIYYSGNIDLGASATWSRLTSPPRTEGHPFNIVVLNDGTLVATYAGRLDSSNHFTASSGVFVSTNNGTTWLDRSGPDMQYFCRDITIDPADPTQNTWYVGVWTTGSTYQGGGLYKTANRGLNWTLVPGTTVMDQVTQAAFNPTDSNEMYITTAEKGLWYTANAHAASPTFTRVDQYPFAVPERVFFDPYDPKQVWITSYGNGLRVGVANTVHNPQLSNGSVSPTSGDTSTSFTWYVDYYDQDGDVASTINVYVDGTAHGMSLNSGSAANGTYRYGPMNLGALNHSYYFDCTDGHGGSATTTTYSGPLVSGGGQQGYIGIFRNGSWALDANWNCVWEGTGTDIYRGFGQSGDVPVVGDWNGDGKTEIGIFRNGIWALDYSGNGQWDGTTTDRVYYFGQAGDVPVVGDWNGSGTDKIGIYRSAWWALDYNGNGAWDYPSADKLYLFGISGDKPVAGDWSGSGKTKIGIVRQGGTDMWWALDFNGNGQWDGIYIDRVWYFAEWGAVPIVGDWNGDGKDQVGIFRNGTPVAWVLDYSGNLAWDGASTDRFYAGFGASGDKPVVGKWSASAGNVSLAAASEKTVQPMPAEVSANPASGSASLEVASKDVSPGLAMSWTWDLGVGVAVTEQSPVRVLTSSSLRTAKGTISQMRATQGITITGTTSLSESSPAVALSKPIDGSSPPTATNYRSSVRSKASLAGDYMGSPALDPLDLLLST